MGLPLPFPGSPQPHLLTEVCARDQSLLLLCGDLLGHKAIGGDDDVIRREAV